MSDARRRQWGRTVSALAIVSVGVIARAMRTKEGDRARIYIPDGHPLAIDLRRLRAAAFRASWFDPRTGRSRSLGEFPRRGARTFDPPGEAARGNDWVLALDAAAPGAPQ